MEQQTSSQLFRPYVPAALRNALGAGMLRPGQVQTYQATILYTDLSGFTRLTATFASLPDGAERLHSILRNYFETMIATIAANGGDVIHIAGDAFTAWWPNINDPALAIHCGYALHNAIAALNPIITPHGPYNLELRVGVSVGTVYLALVGIPNQGIHPVLIGQPINAASLAEQQAQPGEVQLLVTNSQPAPVIEYQPPIEAPILTWEHFLPPSFARRLRLNTLVAEYRRCVPVFAAFDLPENPIDLQPLVMQAQSVAMRWGGWLNEIEVGNKGAVMVFLFSAPVPHGDDTSRAIGCALELRDRGVIRKAGITVGSLFVGEVGSRLRRVYTAQGEDMNLAARLMELAAHGEILISGRVRQDTIGRYRTSPPQLMSIKGYDHDIPAAKVLSDRIRTDESGSHALRAALPTHITLIGRDREQMMIDQVIDRSTHHSNILLIEGETGIGKSTLLYYLSLEWLKRGYHGFRGECHSGTQERPLHPWRAIVGELCDIDDYTPMYVRRARLQQALTELPTAMPHQIAALARLLDVEGFPPPAKLIDLAPLVVELLLNRLKREPILIILEDVHWADPDSLLLLREIIEVLTPHLPLLVVLSYRPLPDHLVPFAQTLRQLPFTTHHLLERLPVADRANLICELIGVRTIDPRLLQYLERYATGQPLFIKEYVRLLLQKGLIAIEQDEARLLGPLPHVQLSSSAIGIVQARIDQMDERTRLTCKVAAVIGRSFPLHLLHHIHPARLSETELRHDIELLVHDQLLETEMADPEPVYRFSFGIAQEAAYTSLLFAQRRELHQAIYQWYATAYHAELAQREAPLAVYDVIIHHALRAELWPEVIEYCQQAALISARRSLFNSALRYLEQGIGLPGHGERRAELLAVRMLLNDRTGNHLYQSEDFALLQSLLRERQQPSITAIAAVLHLRHILISGALHLFDAHLAYAQLQVDRLNHSNAVLSRLLQANIWLITAQRLALKRQEREALTHLQRVDRLCTTLVRQPAPDHALATLMPIANIAAQSHELQGWILVEMGTFQQAHQRFQRANELARAANDWIVENRALIGLCHTMLNGNQLDEAERQLQQALHIAHSIGDRYGQVLGLRTQALLHANRQDGETARRLIRQAIAIAGSSRIAILGIALVKQLEGLGSELEQQDDSTED